MYHYVIFLNIKNIFYFNDKIDHNSHLILRYALVFAVIHFYNLWHGGVMSLPGNNREVI